MPLASSFRQVPVPIQHHSSSLIWFSTVALAVVIIISPLLAWSVQWQQSESRQDCPMFHGFHLRKSSPVCDVKLLANIDFFENQKSAFCDGIATTVTIAHHFVWRHLYASMQAAQTPARKLRFVTPDKESSMNTLWQKEEFEQICSRESLTEKAADIGKTISVKEHERERYDFDPTIFYENLFWNWRPDSMVIKVGLGIFHIMSPKEFPQGSAC